MAILVKATLGTIMVNVFNTYAKFENTKKLTVNR